MKALAMLLLSLSMPGARVIPPLRSPVDRSVIPQARRGGRWYFAQNGHAVYCYGPVKVLSQPQGGIQRVATYCQGTKPIVPLMD
jgi:hypothetical protein